MVAVSAYAADATSSATADAASAPVVVGDVVVTAQRRSESLQKTPVAVTAFGQDEVKTQAISTFRDLSGKVPGLLEPRRSTAYTTQTYAIRGIGEIDTYPEPAVAVYVDDVYLARTVGSNYDTPDLERVEVLRGPQGTLYGRNSSAGAIRYITKDPASVLGGELGVTYGNYNNVEIKGQITGPILADDKLDGSIAIDRHLRDGWTDAVNIHQWVNNLDITALRGKLKSQVTSKLTATLSFDGMIDRSSQSYYTPVNQPNGLVTGAKTNPNITYTNTLPYNQTEVYGGSLTLKYDLTDHLALKSVTAVRGMNGPIYYDNDGVTQVKGDSYAGFDENFRTQEFDLNGEYDKLNFVSGLYYFYEYFDNDRFGQSATSPIDNIGLITHVHSYLRTESYAAFGQLNYKITPKLTLTVGGRYTVDNRTFLAYGQRQNGQPLFDNEVNPNAWQALFNTAVTTGANAYSAFVAKDPWISFASFTPKAGLEYQWNPDVLTYFTFSQGFKSGGYDLRATTLAAATAHYLPQTTTAYELGLKAKLFEGRLTSNTAIYYNQIHDLQERATDRANGTNTLINTGDGDTSGLEQEFAAVPVEGLKLTASVAYLHTHYDTFTAILPANPAGRTTLLGLDFPFAPHWTSAISAVYRLPLNTPGDWRIAADANYESKRYADIYNTSQIQVNPQTFVNASLSYTTADTLWTGAIAVKNLFNLQQNQAGGYAPTNAGAQPYWYYAFNEPRFVNVSITRKF
jgi:iron complex outermembrane receptor protein